MLNFAYFRAQKIPKQNAVISLFEKEIIYMVQKDKSEMQ